MSHYLIRFVNYPALLSIPDDPVGGKTRVESLAFELKPRDKDQGQASFWEAKTEHDGEHINAGFAVRRHKPDRLVVLRLPRDLVVSLGIEVREEVDSEAFDCISDLHRLLHLEDEDLRLRLAQALFDALDAGHVQPSDLLIRIPKRDVLNLIISVYNECRSSLQVVEPGKASEWVRSKIEGAGSPLGEGD